MAEHIKAQIAHVNLGHVKIEGLLGEDGKLYVAAPQISMQFNFSDPQKNLSRDLKALVGEDVKFVKLLTPLNPKPVNCVSFPDEFNSLVLELARAGNAKAQQILGWVTKADKPKGLHGKSKFLYVFGTDDGLYIKIGVSTHPLRRQKEVQTGCPSPVKLILSKKILKARNVEAKLHKLLADFNTSGEWFDSSVYSMVDWNSIA